MVIDKGLVPALLMIRNLPQFAPFLEYLRREQQDAVNVLKSSPNTTTLLQAQGSVRVLDKVLQDIGQAPKLAERLEKEHR